MNCIVLAMTDTDNELHTHICLQLQPGLQFSDYIDPTLMVRSFTKVVYSLSRCKRVKLFYWLGPVLLSNTFDLPVIKFGIFDLLPKK